jgi:ketosteroid isomerase-like protein
MNQQAAQSDTAQTREMLARHLECFAKLDLAGTMTDYAEESRLFSPGGVIHGTESIREFYGTLFDEFKKPGTSFDLLQQEVDDNTAYIVWKAETAENLFELCTDTFIVENGEIMIQTFAGKISPKN